MRGIRSGSVQQEQKPQHSLPVLEQIIPSTVPEEEQTDAVESEKDDSAENIDLDWEAETREEPNIPA